MCTAKVFADRHSEARSAVKQKPNLLFIAPPPRPLVNSIITPFLPACTVLSLCVPLQLSWIWPAGLELGELGVAGLAALLMWALFLSHRHYGIMWRLQSTANNAPIIWSTVAALTTFLVCMNVKHAARVEHSRPSTRLKL